MNPNTSAAVAKAQVADAIAKVREAISIAEEHEIIHRLKADEPCETSHAAEDAAVRNALLSSEDAMICVLETLPSTPGIPGPLIN